MIKDRKGKEREYTGELLNGKACGFGTYKDEHTTYSGHYVNDIWQGYLIYFSCGITDYRECKNGQMHGKATSYDNRIICNKLYKDNNRELKKEVRMAQAFFDHQGAAQKALEANWRDFVEERINEPIMHIDRVVISPKIIVPNYFDEKKFGTGFEVNSEILEGEDFLQYEEDLKKHRSAV